MGTGWNMWFGTHSNGDTNEFFLNEFANNEKKNEENLHRKQLQNERVKIAMVNEGEEKKIVKKVIECQILTMTIQRNNTRKQQNVFGEKEENQKTNKQTEIYKKNTHTHEESRKKHICMYIQYMIHINRRTTTTTR